MRRDQNCPIECGMTERINEMGTEIRDLQHETKGLTRAVGEHHAALFGNGRPGLKDRLSKLEFYTVVESRFLYWALGIGTAVVAAKIKGLF